MVSYSDINKYKKLIATPKVNGGRCLSIILCISVAQRVRRIENGEINKFNKKEGHSMLRSI